MKYGRVKARFVAGVGDSDDEGTAPDVLPLSGSVTFTLSATALRVVTASPVPTTVYPTPIVAELDGEGYLTYRGSRLVSLLATDDPASTPTDLQWSASFDLRSPLGHSITATSFRFQLPAGTIVDLTEVAPILDAAPNIVITKGERGEPGPTSIPTAQFIGSEIERAGSPAAAAVVQTAKSVGDPRYAPLSVVETVASVAVMAAPTPQSYSSLPRFRRPPELLERPVLRAEQTSASSITWANMVENPSHPDANKRWWLFYSTDHASVHSTTGLFAATAPTPFGPFTDRGLIWRDDTAGLQHETPRVWKDRRLGLYVHTYSMQNAAAARIPDAVGSQVSLWATSPDLINWTRRGIAADVTPTDPGDGHTGYMNGPIVVGGREYFYTLFGGTVRGLRTLWRRQPGSGFSLVRDQRVIGSQLNMLRSMQGQSIAITGTPSAASDVTQAGNAAVTSELMWRPTHSAFIAFRGATWVIGPAGNRQAGGVVVDNEIIAAPMASHMAALAEPPSLLDVGDPAPWETSTRFDNFGNTFAYQGRCMFMYRSGGHRGAFGIGEVN